MADEWHVLLSAGFFFPECPRWHEGRLWFSDVVGRKVMTTSLGGELEVAAELDGVTAGLGFLPDGDLLAVQVTDRRIMRIGKDWTAVHADVGREVPLNLNDMVVDDRGFVYVSTFAIAGTDPRNVPYTPVLLVRPEGRVRAVPSPLAAPNGMTIATDSRTLVVNETAAGRVSAFDIDADGGLSKHRVLADLGSAAAPDGAAQDIDGTWIATNVGREFVRLDARGHITDRIGTGDRDAVACALGGPDGHTLFGLTSRADLARMTELVVAGQPVSASDDFDAQIVYRRVERPRAGWP
jgi:sugar lactone lactonase YvrE